MQIHRPFSIVSIAAFSSPNRHIHCRSSEDAGLMQRWYFDEPIRSTQTIQSNCHCQHLCSMRVRQHPSSVKKSNQESNTYLIFSGVSCRFCHSTYRFIPTTSHPMHSVFEATPSHSGWVRSAESISLNAPSGLASSLSI